MLNNSKTLFKVIVGKVTRYGDSLQWEEPASIKCDLVKRQLSYIGDQIKIEIKNTLPDEKVSVSVVNTMSIEELTVSIAITMHCTLNSSTQEQWEIAGENAKKKLKELFFKVNQFAESNSHTLPKIVVENPLQLEMLGKKIDDTIISVESAQEKVILRKLFDLAQSNNKITYQIDGAESKLQTLPPSPRRMKAGTPVTAIVYVTYYDYLSTKSGVTIKSVNKSITDLKCSDSSQIKKLNTANKLKCEVRVKFSTTIVHKENGKKKEKITGILEVLEIFEDKKCPLQFEIDF